MVPNRLTFAVVAAACVAAAGVGSYLATRQNGLSVAVPAATAGPSAAAPATPLAEADLPSAATKPIPVPAEKKAAQASRPAPASSATAKVAARMPQSGQQLPGQDRSRPGVSPSQSPAPLSSTATAPPSTNTTPAAAPVEVRTEELPHAAEPPERAFSELVVSSNSVIGLQTDSALSSETARVEDRVEGHVARDVRVGNQVAIPAGTKALGSVVVVERGGRFKERATLGIRFHQLRLPDGTEVPISTETIYRYGEGPGKSSTTKIGGGAAVGAILGAIIGGGKGAAIGATSGAGAGSVAVAASDRSVATFPAGAEVTARILAPISFTVEKARD